VAKVLKSYGLWKIRAFFTGEGRGGRKKRRKNGLAKIKVSAVFCLMFTFCSLFFVLFCRNPFFLFVYDAFCFQNDFFAKSASG